MKRGFVFLAAFFASLSPFVSSCPFCWWISHGRQNPRTERTKPLAVKMAEGGQPVIPTVAPQSHAPHLSVRRFLLVASPSPLVSHTTVPPPPHAPNSPGDEEAVGRGHERGQHPGDSAQVEKRVDEHRRERWPRGTGEPLLSMCRWAGNSKPSWVCVCVCLFWERRRNECC